jgi:hypothetical protein
MRTFAERSLAEAKRQNMVVTLKIDGANMKAEFREEESDKDAKSSKTQSLSDGFNGNNSKPSLSELGVGEFPPAGITSQQVIGTSGITNPGAFVACGGRGFCGAVVKKVEKNSFDAWIKKGSGASWSPI